MARNYEINGTGNAILMIKPKKLDVGSLGIKVKSRIIPKKGIWTEFNGILPINIKRQLVEEGKNWVCVITGRPRIGKSWSAIRLAEAIDENFSNEQIVFTAEQFLDLVKGKEENEKIRDGSIIVWDEAGIGLSSKNWFSILNKSVNFILQTWGYKHLGLILSVPHFSFIDASTRKLVNTHIHIYKRMDRVGVTRAKIHDLTPSQIKGKDVIKYTKPRIIVGGRKFSFERIEITKPSVKIRHKYEEQKKEFVKLLEESTRKDIAEITNNAYKLETKIKTAEELAEEIYDSVVHLIKKRKDGMIMMPTEIIQTMLSVSRDRAKQIRYHIVEKYKKEHQNS